MGRGTAYFRLANNTISSEGKQLARNAQSKSSTKGQEDNMGFQDRNKNDLKCELTAAMTVSIWLSQLFDDVCAEVANLRERLSAKHVVIGSIIED